MNSLVFLLLSFIFSNLCSLCLMSEILRKNASLNSKKIDTTLDEAIIPEFFKYSFEGTLSLSGANRNLRKILGPLIRSYIIDSFEYLFSKSEVTPEFLDACRLRREASLSKAYSQFMPDLKTSKKLLKKLVFTVDHELLAPLIKRTFERATGVFSDQDENSLSVYSKLIIEKSIRDIYIDYILDKSMHALEPSFNKFCNFVDDIYGNRIYNEVWLRYIRNYNIRLFELSYVQKTLICQNLTIFYYIIDKRIVLAGFYRRLIELQSSELLANRNFDYIRLKELEIQSYFRVVNELLPILAALSFHYFGIYKCFYLWLIAAKFSEILYAVPIQNIHNVVGVFLLPLHLLKNNSYLILVLMLLMHFKCYLFGTGVQSLSSEL